MNDCVFCKIISNEIPGMKVFEDKKTLAFMDIAGDVDGHILVVPKKHVKSILDCDTETLQAVFETVKSVSEYLVNECGYDGVNLLNASDESAGQSVPHFHIHIIPRKNGDGIDSWPKFTGATKSIEECYNEIISNS